MFVSSYINLGEQVARAPHLSGNIDIFFSGFKIFLVGALCICVVQNLAFYAQLL